MHLGGQGFAGIEISNSRAEDISHKLGIPLYQMGFLIYKVLGNTTRVTIGYRHSASDYR